MDLENRRWDGSRKIRSSLVRSEDSMTEFNGRYRPDDFRLPATAIIKKAEHTNRRTNLTTGLTISESNINFPQNTILMKSCIEQMVSQKSCMKIGTVRPLTCRRENGRLIPNKRHFLGVIHLKIRELTEEIERLDWKYKEAQQENANALVYEVKAKELAVELTSFQEVLADLNLAFEYISTNGDIEKLELEAQELFDINDSERNKIELLFCERKMKEDFINQLEINELIEPKTNESSPDTKLEGRDQINSLTTRCSQSSRAVKFWEKQIQHYNKIRSTLSQDLQKQFPPVSEIVKLETELLQIKKKWKDVAENTSSKLNNERQELLEKVKLDKIELSTMMVSINDISKKINDIQEVFGSKELLDNTEVNTKEAMDINMASFDIVKEQKINKLKLLEADLINSLSQLQRNLSSVPTTADYINFQEKMIDIKDFTDELETVSEEHGKIMNYLKKIELMECNIEQECRNLDKKCHNLKNDLEEYLTFNKLNNVIKKRENELISKKILLEEEKPKHLEEMDKAKNNLEKLNQEISENEKHKEILHLEDRLIYLEKSKMLKKQSVEEIMKTKSQLLDFRKETLNLIELYNIHLQNNSNG